jgi:hypothetical protein
MLDPDLLLADDDRQRRQPASTSLPMQERMRQFQLQLAQPGDLECVARRVGVTS